MNKKIYIYMVMFIFFFIMFVFFINFLSKLSFSNKEGFESYTSCLNQGYPNWFCIDVPVQACLVNCD
jgi:hypothetical protein